MVIYILLGLSTFLLESPIDIVLFIIIFFPPKKNLRRDTYCKTLWIIIFDILKDAYNEPNALDL
jgi:hypothetical protein